MSDNTNDPTKADDYAVNVLRRSPSYLRPVDGPNADKRSPWEEIARGMAPRKKDALARVRRRLRREDARKIEAEWTACQKVSGGDYARLPIGSVVFDEPAAEDTVASVPVLKTGEDEWTNQGWPGVFTNAEMADDVRTLTHLGGAS